MVHWGQVGYGVSNFIMKNQWPLKLSFYLHYQMDEQVLLIFVFTNFEFKNTSLIEIDLFSKTRLIYRLSAMLIYQMYIFPSSICILLIKSRQLILHPQVRNSRIHLKIWYTVQANDKFACVILQQMQLFPLATTQQNMSIAN